MTSPDPTGTTDTTPETRSDPDRTARALTGKADQAVRAPTLELRQGVIQAVDVPNARVTVALGGDTTGIPSVAHVSNYRPAVNDTVQVLVNGPDLYVLDRAGAFGPSVISTAVSAFSSADETTSSESYGDLPTVGPSATVSISPSGRLLVQVSCWIEANAGSTPTSGKMSFALSGANTRSPNDDEAIVVHHDHSSTTLESNITVCASKISLVTGLNAGTTTVTAKYASIFGGDSRFFHRHVWAMPF